MNAVSRLGPVFLAIAGLVGAAEAAAQHPTSERLVQLAAASPDYSCYDNPYCILAGEEPEHTGPTEAEWDALNSSFGSQAMRYTGELDVWWSRDGRGLMLLDFRHESQPGCGEVPCGLNDVYASRYVNGVVRDEKFSRIGVPYRGQRWSEVKRTLPAALGAEIATKVAEFRRISGLEGELTMDIQLPEKGTDILVFVTGGDYDARRAESLDGRIPLYRLKWDAARGVFVPARL